MKRLSVLLLALVLAVSLTACGGNKIDAKDPSVGKWSAVSITMLGFSMDVSQVFPGGVTVELNTNGKGTFVLDDKKDSLTWTVTNGEIDLKVDDTTFTGSIIDNQLFLDSQETGMTYVFEKE